MKRITNAEIRALKDIIKAQNERIKSLEFAFDQQRKLTERCKRDNDLLWKELEESRDREGRGCLESAIECIGQVVTNICDAFSGFDLPHDGKFLNVNCEHFEKCDNNCDVCEIYLDEDNWCACPDDEEDE